MSSVSGNMIVYVEKPMCHKKLLEAIIKFFKVVGYKLQNQHSKLSRITIH
jgi:hypothetical protein